MLRFAEDAFFTVVLGVMCASIGVLIIETVRWLRSLPFIG